MPIRSVATKAGGVTVGVAGARPAVGAGVHGEAVGVSRVTAEDTFMVVAVGEGDGGVVAVATAGAVGWPIIWLAGALGVAALCCSDAGAPGLLMAAGGLVVRGSVARCDASALDPPPTASTVITAA